MSNRPQGDSPLESVTTTISGGARKRAGRPETPTPPET
jgi:hypothetical protein